VVAWDVYDHQDTDLKIAKFLSVTRKARANMEIKLYYQFYKHSFILAVLAQHLGDNSYIWPQSPQPDRTKCWKCRSCPRRIGIPYLGHRRGDTGQCHTAPSLERQPYMPWDIPCRGAVPNTSDPNAQNPCLWFCVCIIGRLWDHIRISWWIRQFQHRI
jgi:hypothetical protein